MLEKPNFLQTNLVKRILCFYRKTVHGDKLSAESTQSAAHTLLKYAGTWAGNDLEECLQEVLHSRGEAQF